MFGSPFGADAKAGNTEWCSMSAQPCNGDQLMGSTHSTTIAQGQSPGGVAALTASSQLC